MWNLTRYLLWIVYCGLALLFFGIRFVPKCEAGGLSQRARYRDCLHANI
jgi:hypothetical protein